MAPARLVRAHEFRHPCKRLRTSTALDDPYAVASLLDSLRAAGTQDQATALLARDPAAHVALDGPRARGLAGGQPAGGGR
jgi:hypothetical protein